MIEDKTNEIQETVPSGGPKAPAAIDEQPNAETVDGGNDQRKQTAVADARGDSGNAAPETDDDLNVQWKAGTDRPDPTEAYHAPEAAGHFSPRHQTIEDIWQQLSRHSLILVASGSADVCNGVAATLLKSQPPWPTVSFRRFIPDGTENDLDRGAERAFVDTFDDLARMSNVIRGASNESADRSVVFINLFDAPDREFERLLAGRIDPISDLERRLAERHLAIIVFVAVEWVDRINRLEDVKRPTLISFDFLEVQLRGVYQQMRAERPHAIRELEDHGLQEILETLRREWQSLQHVATLRLSDRELCDTIREIAGEANPEKWSDPDAWAADLRNRFKGDRVPHEHLLELIRANQEPETTVLFVAANFDYLPYDQFHRMVHHLLKGKTAQPKSKGINQEATANPANETLIFHSTSDKLSVEDISKLTGSLGTRGAETDKSGISVGVSNPDEAIDLTEEFDRRVDQIRLKLDLRLSVHPSGSLGEKRVHFDSRQRARVVRAYFQQEAAGYGFRRVDDIIAANISGDPVLRDRLIDILVARIMEGGSHSEAACLLLRLAYRLGKSDESDPNVTLTRVQSPDGAARKSARRPTGRNQFRLCAKVIGGLLVDDRRNEAVASFFETLLRGRRFQDSLILIQFVSEHSVRFDAPYWLRQVIERGDEAAVEAACRVIAQAVTHSDRAARVYMSQLIEWLSTGASRSRARQAAPDIITRILLTATSELHPKDYGAAETASAFLNRYLFGETEELRQIAKVLTSSAVLGHVGEKSQGTDIGYQSRVISRLFGWVARPPSTLIEKHEIDDLTSQVGQEMSEQLLELQTKQDISDQELQELARGRKIEIENPDHIFGLLSHALLAATAHAELMELEIMRRRVQAFLKLTPYIMAFEWWLAARGIDTDDPGNADASVVSHSERTTRAQSFVEAFGRALGRDNIGVLRDAEEWVRALQEMFIDCVMIDSDLTRSERRELRDAYRFKRRAMRSFKRAVIAEIQR